MTMAVVETTSGPTLVAFDAGRSRERVRSSLALLLVGLVVFEIVGIVWIAYALFTHSDGQQIDKAVSFLKDVAGIILSPTIALAGAVMGFYFATGKES
jgi:ABC-type cobalamin transport system permease subunit